MDCDSSRSHGKVIRTPSVRGGVLSLFESGDSTGQISIQSMFDGVFEDLLTGDVGLDRMIFLTARGGWSDGLSLDDEEALKLASKHLDQIDIRNLSEGGRDEIKFRMFLRALARNESSLVSKRGLLRDISEHEGYSISHITLDSYLEDLQKLGLISNIEAFDPGLRASDRVGKAVKRHLVDPSLSIAVLGHTPLTLLDNLALYMTMFEAMCDRDLDIYATALGGKLYHYRDKEGYELDAVIVLADGRWGAFEIKLGFYQVDEGAENLNKVCDYIGNNSRVGPPVFKCVICGTAIVAMRRNDGVYVVPITALRN